jgi:hypothetical protein
MISAAGRRFLATAEALVALLPDRELNEAIEYLYKLAGERGKAPRNVERSRASREVRRRP